MNKVLTSGVVISVGLALLTGSALAAPAQTGFLTLPPPAQSWVITPGETACRTEIELVGRSGVSLQAALVSDGRQVALAFTREGIPERAFLPIRVNQKAYSNLVLRTADPRAGEMVLSEESLAAVRKGGTLHVGWLADEPLSASLAGSDQGLADLRTCGAQVAAQHRNLIAARDETKARSEAQAQAQAMAQEQLAAARAQRVAAEAEADRERIAARAEADRQRAESDRLRSETAEYEDPRWALPRRPLPYEPGWGYRPYYPVR